MEMNYLVNFKVKNFRSFYEETIFSMEAISNKEYSELNTFCCDERLFSKGENELLKTAILFGANASGKTNVIKSLDYMRAMVLSSSTPGNIVLQNNATFAFFSSAEGEPTLFEIEIVSNDVFYDYGFEITGKKISKEFLKRRSNGRLTDVFTRSIMGIELNAEKRSGKPLGMISDQNLFISFANTPFLSVDDRTKIDMQNVLNWFSEPNLFIINEGIMNRYSIYQEEGGKYAESALRFLKQADIGIEGFSVFQEKISDQPQGFIEVKGIHPPQLAPMDNQLLGLDLRTQFNVFDNNENIVGTKDVFLEKDFGFHSDGTYRLVSILGLILKVLDRGGVIVIDEIDSKLNFLIVDYILKAFNSIDKNINNAQLITTAHNVLLMDDDLRRDQIYFASKNRFGATEIYSLSDFKDVRKSDLFSKKYLAGFYSAIPKLKEF